MKVLRRLFITMLSLLAVGLAQAQPSYPNKPVKLLVGFAPGGATDLLARFYAKKMTEQLGQTFIVENRPGAGGNTAINVLTQSDPDGYTIAMAANYIASNAALKRNPYDWDTELAPLAMIAGTPNLLVVPENSKINSVKALIAAATQSGAQLTYGSAGMGTSIHLAGELFQNMANVKFTHVPYKGVSPAEIDLVAGRVDMMFGSISTALPLVEAKKLKAIAITGPTRLKKYPDIPTISETGLKGFDVQAIYFLVAPAKTPVAIQQKIAQVVENIAKEPDTIVFLEGIYANPMPGGPAETKAFLQSEYTKWQKLVNATGLKVD